MTPFEYATRMQKLCKQYRNGELLTSEFFSAVEHLNWCWEHPEEAEERAIRKLAKSDEPLPDYETPAEAFLAGVEAGIASVKPAD